MALVRCNILVLSPAPAVRDDLVDRLSTLDAGTIATAASLEHALPLLAGGRHIVLADPAATDGDIPALAAALPAAGGSVGIVLLTGEHPGELAAPVAAAVAPDAPTLELGVAIGRAAQLAAEAPTLTDAERDLDELSALMPNTAAMLYDADLVCRMARGPLIERTGREGVELVGTTVAEQTGPGWEYLRPYWEAALRGSRQQFDFAVPDSDEVYAADLIPRRAGGRVAGIVCVTADVTAQRRAEAAERGALDELASREARYRATVDNLFEGVTFLTSDGVWVANESARRMTGLTDEQAAGREPLPDGWHMFREDGSRWPLNEFPGYEARKTGEPQRNVLMGLDRGDGEKRWLLVNAKPIPALGEPGRRDSVVSFVDVTAQRAAERALAGEHDALAEAQSIARMGSWRQCLRGGTYQWSDEMCRIFGRRPGDPPATFAEMLEHIHRDDRALLQRMWDQHHAHGPGPFEVYFRLVHRSGATAYVHMRARIERDETGRPVAVKGVIQDVTERQEAELALRAAQRRFEAAFDEAPIGMSLTDADGRNIRVNRALCELTGHSHSALLQMRYGPLGEQQPAPEDLVALNELLSGKRQRLHGERRLIGADGRAMWVQISSARLQITPDEPPVILSHFLDISHRHRLERRLRHLAEHDPLTGVPNRRAWDVQVPQAIQDATVSGQPLALALLDLNDFKAVNDTLGHDAGDRVLREVAASWRGQLRETDLLARLGGDEFAVLLPDCAEGDLLDLARRLRGGLAYEPGCSVGAVTWHPGESAEDVLRRADEELYRDKLVPRESA
ncbi:MAG: PAS domain S-box protein [Solirubrobacteraceae bacterium]|nr:PAS domain S-box protein [Solirubrobacteraceae bacterium]